MTTPGVSDALAAILGEFQIAVIDPRAFRKPGQTYARETLEKILARHGAEHLRFLLLTITESENNRAELVEPVLWAISDIMLDHPAWPARGSEWLEVFDDIDLTDLRERARGNRRVKQRSAINTELYRILRSRLGVAHEQGRLFHRGQDHGTRTAV